MKPNWRRWVVTVLVIGLFVLGTSPVLARSKISIIGPFASWGASLHDALRDFSTQHNVDVEVITVHNWVEQRTKVATMSAAGVAPDLLYGDNSTTRYFANERFSQPLDRFIKDIDLSVYPSVIMEAMYVRDQLYALPTAVSLHNLYYNVDYLAAVGMGRLPTKWESDDFSWSDYVTLVKKLTIDTNGDGRPERYGAETLGYGSIGFNTLGMWGLHLLDADGTKWYGDSAEVISALEKVVPLHTEYNAIGGSLLKGTAAINPIQNYYLNNLMGAGSGLHWSVGVMPKGTQRASQAGFHGLSISHDSKNPRLAWELVKYLAYNPQGTIQFTRAENRVPVLRPAARDFVERWSKVLSDDEAWCIVGAAGYTYDTRLSRPLKSTDVSKMIEDAGRRIHDGLASVRQVMEEISPQIRALLN